MAADKEWVWVIAVRESGGEQFLALDDPAAGRRFIPAFATKEDGIFGLAKLGRTEGEVQAIQEAVLADLAGHNGLAALLLDRQGRVVRAIA